MPRLAFATNNPGKLLEVKQLAASYGVKVFSPKDLGVTIDVDETGDSYEQNAQLKASALLEKIKDNSLWVAGDDSGVGIDALNGEPGIHSRRWAGYEMSDQEIIDYTLRKLRGVPPEKRTAHFVSVVVLGRSAKVVNAFRGEIGGVILEKPDLNIKPQKGFPFRQLFNIPEIDKLLGEAEETDPTFITHRQKAFVSVFEYMKTHEAN